MEGIFLLVQRKLGGNSVLAVSSTQISNILSIPDFPQVLFPLDLLERGKGQGIFCFGVNLN